MAIYVLSKNQLSFPLGVLEAITAPQDRVDGLNAEEEFSFVHKLLLLYNYNKAHSFS